MGSLLIQKGIQSEGDPSLLNMSHPDVIRDIHKSYASAGADFMTTNTFGANRYKLDGSSYTVEQVVTKAVELAAEIVNEAKDDKYVALDIGSNR